MNFFDSLDRFGDAPALISENSEVIRYSELSRFTKALPPLLEDRSLVFCLCGNSLPSVVGYLGLLQARSVPALVADSIHPDLLRNLLANYRPGFLWLPKEKLAIVDRVEPVYEFGGYFLAKTSFEGGFNLHPQLALLLTTSGSTGSPKFVRQSYENIASNTESIVQYLGMTSSDRAITTMPMSYTYGLSIINSHLSVGASIVLTNRTLMEKPFWELLKNSAATNFGGVPYIYEMLKKLRFERMTLPALQYMTQAGGRLNQALSREFAEIGQRMGVRFIVMYGQTEATARMTYLPWESAIPKAGSIGIPIPGGELWLEDTDGRRIETPDTVGELVYRGANVTLGYAEGYKDLAKGDENGGVLKTGDLARFDREGFFFIVGRKKRFLKLFGNRVNLDEMEQLLKSAGFDCACDGEDDNLTIYVTDENIVQEVRNSVLERTGINQTGFQVRCIPSIPRNESGKPIYARLKSGG